MATTVNGIYLDSQLNSYGLLDRIQRRDDRRDGLKETIAAGLTG
jgi:hypothetical protein